MGTALPRSTPTAAEVDARRVVAYLDAVAAERLDLHSLMVVRHGAVVAEGWWAPYRPTDPQLLYSLSKTFLAMGVGIAIGEGRFGLDDLAADLLPGQVPDPRPPHLEQLRVRHLLSMASGHAAETLPMLLGAGPDPVAGFLGLAPDADPGTLFAYNQGNPLTLSAIVSAHTGERLVDYLRPRLLDPLGIDDARWLQMLPGLDQGFSGFHVTTESIAKLGQLLLQDGEWDGRQLVPAAYVAECKQRHVDNSEQSIDPDWQQGYGFQMWMCRHGAQRGDGALGQLCVLLPEHDAVIAVTAQVADMQRELDLVWEHLLPAMAGPGDAGADAVLAERLADLSVRQIDAPAVGPAETVTFRPAPAAEPYTSRIEAVRVEPNARLVVTTGGFEHAFELRPGAWTDGELPGLHTPFPEVSVTGGWVDDDTFHADLVSRRTPHRLKLRATRSDDPTVEIRWSAAPLPIPTVGP